jgi:predicted membrane-bound spermidine synthase
MAAFTNLDINNKRALDHFLILEQDYAPTIVIRKTPFVKEEVAGIKNVIKTIPLSLIIFSCIGMGFIIIEFSLFQKLILYLGSPTTSLSILLSSLLVSMGFGSYFSKKIFKDSLIKIILFASLAFILFGILLFTVLPVIFNKSLA